MIKKFVLIFVSFFILAVAAQADFSEDIYHAKVVLKRGQPRQAIKYLDNMLAIEYRKTDTQKAEITFWKAQCYFALRDYNSAAILCQEAQRADQEFAYAGQANYTIGLARMSQGQYAEAGRIFSTLAEKGTAEIKESALYHLALSYFFNHDPKNAAKVLDRYSVMYKRGIHLNEVYLLAGEIAFAEFDYEKAMENYQRLIPASPYVSQAYLGLGWCYFDLGQYEQASGQFARYLQSAPASLEKCKITFVYAYAQNRCKKYRPSSATLDTLLVTLKDKTRAEYDVLTEYILALQIDNDYKLGDWAKMQARTGLYLQKYPQGQFADLVCFWQGLAFYVNRSPDNAVKCFDMIVDGSILTRSKFFTADILYKKGSYDKASKAYQELVATEELPDFYKAHSVYGLAWCFYKQNNFYKSAKSFDDFLTLFPSDSYIENALFMKARSFFNFNNYELAYKYFMEFLAKYPASNTADNALFLVGYTLYAAGDLEKAFTLYQDMEKKAYRDPTMIDRISYMKASVCLRQKSWQEAIDIFKDLLKTETKVVPAAKLYVELGDAYYGQGNYIRSVETYRSGIAKFPKDIWTKNMEYGIVLCMYKSKKYVAAKEAIKKFEIKYKDMEMCLSVSKNIQVILEEGEQQ